MRISWAIPISTLRSTETIDLMNDNYDSFILNTDLSKGDKSTPLTKGQQGTLHVRGYENRDSERVDWQVINPYYI